jgi:hypothetical protein
MTANSEIAVYLEDLLDHEAGCNEETCARCQSLRNICQAVRTMIFSHVAFPRVAIAAKSRARELDIQATSATAASLPGAA